EREGERERERDREGGREIEREGEREREGEIERGRERKREEEGVCEPVCDAAVWYLQSSLHDVTEFAGFVASQQQFVCVCVCVWGWWWSGCVCMGVSCVVECGVWVVVCCWWTREEIWCAGGRESAPQKNLNLAWGGGG